MRLSIETLTEVGPEIEAAILAPLIAYNERVAGPARYEPLAVLLRDEGGEVAGGLWAEAYYDWCFVRLLVVPEGARGQGLGRRLMGKVEDFALARGDAGIWLDTFSFQARGFYEKLGFSCFAELPGHPRDGARYFMSKRL